MATYIPGIESYTPEYKAFQPDFKFAQAVLSTRQDRYDTNYKQLNDVYGSVIYADLSREDTKKQRDDFANKLVPNIEKISEMDLSIGANVDVAKAVFNPFIENNLIQQDIYRTSRYKGEMQRAQSLLNAPNPEANKQYWQTGIDYLNYQMQDFVNASPEEAIRQPIPTYVPNANLYDMALDYLKESGIEVKDFYFTKDKKFIIKQKNGELIYDASYDRVKRALASNGRVQQAYAADGYVRARRYAEQGVNAGKYQTINDGRVAWAQNTLADINFKATALQLQHEGKVKELSDLQKKHESKINQVGEENLSPMEKRSYEDVLMNLTEVEEQAENNRTLLESMGTMTSDQEGLLNRAYATLMNWNISDDLRAAAKSYSMQGASRDIEVNDFQRDIEKNKLDMMRDAVNNSFKAEENEKNRENALKVAGKYVDPELAAAMKGLNTGGQSISYVANEEGEPNADADILELAEQENGIAGSRVKSSQIETFLKYHQLDQAGLGAGGTPEQVTIPTANGNKVFTINEAREILQKPEHQAWLQEQYANINNALKDPESRAKLAPHISDIDATKIKNEINTTSGLSKRIARAEQEINKRGAANFERALKFENLQGVPDVVKDLKSGIPSIVQNGKVMNEESFIKQVIEKAKDDHKQKIEKLEQQKTTPYIFTSPARPADSLIRKDVFNEEQARESAEKAYAKQKAVLNRTFNDFYNYDTSVGDPKGKVENTSFQPFDIYTVLRGGSMATMTDGTAFMSNSYNAIGVGAPTLNSMDPEQKVVVIDFIKQVGKGGVKYLPGDAIKLTNEQVEEIDPAENEKARRLVGQALMDLNVAVSGGSESKTGLFSVSYIDAYGAIDSPTKQGAYVITFDQDYINKSVGLSGDDAQGTGIITKQEKDAFSTVTIMVNRDEDISGYSINNYNFSDVDTEIQFDGSYKKEVPAGGTFKIWKDGDTYKTSIEQSTYDPTAGTDDNYVKTNYNAVPLVYPKSYGSREGQLVTPNDVQQVADFMELKLAKIASQNIAAKNLRNKKN